MSNFDFAAFDAAVNSHYGFISGLLVQECGCRIIHGSPGGANISLWCPNHGDTPKNNRGNYLHCNDTKGAWKCFKCENEGNHMAHEGHAVQAIMEYRHLEAKEAFKYLCDKIGFQTTHKVVYRDTDIRSMYVTACHDLLMQKQNEAPYAEAMQYLLGRGFTMQTIKKHRLGFCTGYEAVNVLRKKGLNDTQLFDAGVLSRSRKTGKLYPTFLNRVVMMTGNNIFGRSIEKDAVLRHMYTRDHNSVFNELVLGREWDAIFVVEGAFDAMSIEQYIHALGANWAVIGTCGTKGIKNVELVNLLKECLPAEVIIVPDNDNWYNDKGVRHAAGQRAGLDKARALEAAGIRTRIMVLRDGSDPNDLVKEGVPVAEFEAMVQRALSPAKYSIYCEAHYHKWGEHSGNIGFLNAVRKQLGKYKVPLAPEIVDYLSFLTKEPVDEIRRFMLPSLKQCDALDYIRSEIINGKSLQVVFAELQQQLTVQIPV